jgi:hypothetical protein
MVALSPASRPQLASLTRRVRDCDALVAFVNALRHFVSVPKKNHFPSGLPRMGTSSKSRDWSPSVSVSCAGRIDEPPAFFVHAASIPVAVGLTVFSTGADRLEVLTAVSANAFLEFGHMSSSIYKHYNVDVPLV